ncbi:MAG: gamma-glutamyl-gamma-aminobutyrate hydrolase family protein [Clostridia bacterium]|nr:gamma-glutamyl-gamma-aminobutyrate hydrolase family protein [Clostridia bacterium]
MRKPIIGITASYSEDERIWMKPAYVDAVRAAGGIACLLSRPTDPAELAALAADLDGLIFAGGDDIDPSRYGESVQHPEVVVTPERDVFELALFAAYRLTGRPILGICRGIQLINVALGGTLHQHIEGHRQMPVLGSIPVQTVQITPATRLAGLCARDGTLAVNTFHHQAVARLGEGLVVSARAGDGVIEAVELPPELHPFLLGVQWHPEQLFETCSAAHGIFSGFVRACRAQA